MSKAYLAHIIFLLLSLVLVVPLDAQSTRFGDALEKLDIQAVREALKAGADPNERYGGTGQSVLMRTVSSSLLRFSFETMRDQSDSTKLSQLEEKIIAVWEVLFNAGAALQFDDRDMLPLASKYGAARLVKYLLDRGADPNVTTNNGFTPVLVATQYGHRNIVSLLVSYGAKPLDAATEAQVLFIEAAKAGDLISMRDQLAKGARVNARDPAGRTGLVTAISNGEIRLKLRIVKELLGLGASPHQTGQGIIGYTSPLHALVEFTHQDIFERSNGVLIMEALLKAGAHVSSAADWGQRTPLHIAAQFHNAKAVEILLKAGSKVITRDSKGKTPLDYAQSGDVIKLLKSYGAKE